MGNDVAEGQRTCRPLLYLCSYVFMRWDVVGGSRHLSWPCLGADKRHPAAVDPGDPLKRSPGQLAGSVPSWWAQSRGNTIDGTNQSLPSHTCLLLVSAGMQTLIHLKVEGVIFDDSEDETVKSSGCILDCCVFHASSPS